MSLVIGSWTVDLSCVFFYFFSMSVLYVQLVVVAVISRKKKVEKPALMMYYLSARHSAAKTPFVLDDSKQPIKIGDMR